MNSVRAVLCGILGFFFLVAAVSGVCAEDSFARGEALFLRDKPAEALPFLEAAAADDPALTRAFLYLGIAYLQLGRVDDAVAVYGKILPGAGAETAGIAYNLGNACFLKGDFTSAARYYTEAVKADPSYTSAYLNRANTLVKSGDFAAALEDYKTWLSLDEGSAKREKVENLAAVIEEELVIAERADGKDTEGAGEDVAAAGGASETAAKAEAARRAKLIMEVSGSLKSAAEDLRGVSAGFGGL